MRARKDVSQSGQVRYRTVCQKHHRMGWLCDTKSTRVCDWCGWNGCVHRHRVEQNGVYGAENVLMLCPNCHASAHGRGERNKPQ